LIYAIIIIGLNYELVFNAILSGIYEVDDDLNPNMPEHYIKLSQYMRYPGLSNLEIPFFSSQRITVVI